MKKIIFLLAYCILFTVCCNAQVKVIKATQQKTFAGMGGVFMNFIIDFKSKASEKIEIDSVKTIVDSSSIKFGFTKFDPCCKNEISFGYALSQSPRCKTCPEVPLDQFNISKGVIVYYKKDEKKYSFKVKKFKVLPDLKLP